MSNINTATYIKKLVKMVYEKENQIETLKKELRNVSCCGCAGAYRQGQCSNPMEETIKNQLYLTSTQLREVTHQMNAMQSKMVELQLGLEEEIIKNNELVGDIMALKEENKRMRQERFSFQQRVNELTDQNSRFSETIQSSKIEFDEISKQVRTLFDSLQALNCSQEMLRQEKNQLIIEINQIRQREEKSSIHRLELEKQIAFFKISLLQKQTQVELKMVEIQQKTNEIEEKCHYIQLKNTEIYQLNRELNNKKDSISQLQTQIQNKSNELQSKKHQSHHLSESLKNYEQFSFEISKYIESAFIKYCCQGLLRSSKKIIKETEKNQSMFQSSFKKMTQIQYWMDDTAERLEKLLHQQELPNQTLENFSIIVNSVVDKLNQCDITELIQKENEEFIRNEEEVIKNLQKDCEKSLQRERSNLEQIGEVKQQMKLIKDVNRELFEQINQKDYIINECKKIYEKCLPRNCQEYQLMKKILEYN